MTRSLTFILNPNSTAVYYLDGAFVACLESTVPIQVTFDDNAANDFRGGIKLRQSFKKLSFNNTTGNTCRVVCIVGSNGNELDLIYNLDAPTKIVANALVIASGAKTLVSGFNSTWQRRKTAIVSVPSSAAGLVNLRTWVGGPSGTIIAPVYPGEKFAMDTDDHFEIENPQLSAVTVYSTGIYYNL